MKKMINDYEHIPYVSEKYAMSEMFDRSKSFYTLLNKRRSIRSYSSEPVDKEIIEYLIMSAGTAPSGANKQPWTFCAVSNPRLKKTIREAAEKEEKINYSQRMSESWLKDLQPFATSWEKPFLEIAPWLIVVFKRVYEPGNAENRLKNYYVNESVGIACGMLIAAIHHAGLATLTHTPSPMNFLSEILGRPENEKPYLLLPIGYPRDDAMVPKISRKPAKEILDYYE